MLVADGLLLAEPEAELTGVADVVDVAVTEPELVIPLEGDAELVNESAGVAELLVTPLNDDEGVPLAELEADSLAGPERVEQPLAVFVGADVLLDVAVLEPLTEPDED